MKKKFLKSTILSFLILMIIFVQSQAQENPSLQIGYVDKDKNGINDKFSDANGDGINDVTSKSYPHHFKFQDNNDDGLNDLWRDKDGDGVNDLMMKLIKDSGVKPKYPWIDKDGDGIRDPDVEPTYEIDMSQFVLDADNDGENDITGVSFQDSNVMGYRYGCMDEEKGKEIGRFHDNNDDGMHDNFANRFGGDLNQGRKGRKYDYFIDKDGDGIADGRGFKRMGKGKSGQYRGRKKVP